ncbi:hypothetical protein ACUOCP_43825, partial [Escherichia sp. R-CC3]
RRINRNASFRCQTSHRTIKGFFTGIIGMGLLGEYIGRIYTDVRARPRYFVQQVIRPSSKENE